MPMPRLTNRRDRWKESTTGNEADVEQSLESLPVDGSEETEMVETPEWPPAYRMFLPTTAGPLIVDAEIRMGDELLSQVFDRRIQKVIQEAGDDAKYRFDVERFVFIRDRRS